MWLRLTYSPLIFQIMQQNIKLDNYNYCEILVFDRIKSMPEVFGRGVDFVNDVSCVALNRIKPRYIRERIYLFFYITDSEWETLNAEVAESVDFAVHHVEKNLRSAGSGAANRLGILAETVNC